MADYLIFTLYSPMSSWGEIAVGEVRSSKTHPGRSAIFGLIAASLGIRRNDPTGIRSLHENFSLGVKVLTTGHLLKDFHTIRAARSQKNVVYRTRADELNADPDQIGTIISTREYRSDALYVAAIWNNNLNDKIYSLQEIKFALENPVFFPYLGRKSCPPSCKFAPEIISGKNTLKEAFDSYQIKPVYLGSEKKYHSESYEKRVFQTETEFYYWDDCENHGFQELLSTERYDTVRDSPRRQFCPRRENMTLINKRKE